MKRREELTERDVLAWLAGARRPASLREVARGLGLRHPDRRRLQKLVAKLKRAGEITEPQSGRYALPGGKRAAHGQREEKQKPRTETPRGRRPQRAPRKAGGEVVTGRLVAHRDGYGFVVPDAPLDGVEGDVFIPPPGIADAMHGDRVEARVERRSPGRDGGLRAEGRITRVTARAHPTVVGLFRYGPRGNTVQAFDVRITQEIVIPPGEELTAELRRKLNLAPQQKPPRGTKLPELDGAVVDVELTRYPRPGAPAAGRVVEILGRQDDFGMDIEIVIRKHHLPFVFPPEVEAAADAAPQQVREADLAGRRDFRSLPIVTIDGETAKDFDDAVYAEPRGDGAWELQVHIADVAHYVARSSALDREARLRGTSVYFPDRAVPMLPEELSNNICSLNPQVDRLVMSVLMTVDRTGRVTGAEFTPGVIRSAERMTYTNVNKVLEGDAEMTTRYAPLVERFAWMRELAMLLNARRMGRGSIDFDLPEPLIEFDELGRMTKIVRSERNIANRIIEEFMLAANEAVAGYLTRRGIASLHRVHEKPDPKKVLEFEDLARAFGYTLGVADLAERRVPVKHGRAASAHGGRQRQMAVVLPSERELDIRPQHYQRLTEKIAGKPEERIVSYLMLRSLRQARYAAEPLGHFALAAEEYTHFTSPIRRYPDLIVHRVLKWALENPEARPHGGQDVPKDAPAPGSYRTVELEEIAAESSEAERRADTAERELMDWKTAQYMEGHLGEEFEAIVISLLKFGFFVELLEVFVEGLVPIESLEQTTGERWFYRERDRAMVSAKKKTLRLGDRVRVRCDRVDHFRKRVEFSVIAFL